MLNRHTSSALRWDSGYVSPCQFVTEIFEALGNEEACSIFCIIALTTCQSSSFELRRCSTFFLLLRFILFLGHLLYNDPTCCGVVCCCCCTNLIIAKITFTAFQLQQSGNAAQQECSASCMLKWIKSWRRLKICLPLNVSLKRSKQVREKRIRQWSSREAGSPWEDVIVVRFSSRTVDTLRFFRGQGWKQHHCPKTKQSHIRCVLKWSVQ